jgi:hypothetical protein
MKRIGKRSRLVGAGVAGTKGGDACVAHGGRCDAVAQQDEGDASVPSPHNPTPAPTGTKRLPKGYHKQPTRESGCEWMWGGDLYGRPLSTLPMFVCYLRNK